MMSEYAHPYPPNLPYKQQSVPIPGTKRPGQTAVYRNDIFGDLGDLSGPNHLQTLDIAFEKSLKAGKDHIFLGTRPLVSTSPVKYADSYVWQTYGQVDERRRAIGSALHTMFQRGGLGGGEFETVGIWAPNRAEWQILDLATQAYNKVSVSLYDTLGPNAVAYIINHAHVTAIFTSKDHVNTLLKGFSQYPFVKLIVSMDELSPQTKQIYSSWGSTLGVEVTDLRSFEEFGRANPVQPIPATPSQLASICYTSGTTSNPKGVLLTHKMLAAAVQTNLYGMLVDADAVLLSYLPLAHIYGRAAELCVVAVGGAIGYYTGDPLRLIEDAQILKPTFFPSVPRILNRVYQAGMAASKAPGLKGVLFRKALDTKLHQLRTTGATTHAFWDKLVFSKVQAVLGGRVQLLTSGSAPISPDAMDFLKIAFGCHVLEGFGMTETSATCTRCLPHDQTSSGTVGPPQVATEVKLVDVPAMGYTSEDRPFPRGELYARSPYNFRVYYKDEKNTAETVDSEGWVRTGDIACIDDCGRVRIIDRVKNIMKLAQGEYVALEKIENVYSACPLAAQIFVHGDGLQSYLLAVVVPDPAAISTVVSQVLGKKILPDDIKTLQEALQDPKLNQHILYTLTQEARKNGLKGFEMIRRIHLTLDPFTIDEGTLTPTLKIKRKDAYKKFKKELDALYGLGEPPALPERPKL